MFKIGWSLAFKLCFLNIRVKKGLSLTQIYPNCPFRHHTSVPYGVSTNPELSVKVCGVTCVSQRRQSGDGLGEALTVCKYDRRNANVFVLS